MRTVFGCIEISVMATSSKWKKLREEYDEEDRAWIEANQVYVPVESKLYREDV